ncbi:hypothetical protein J3Q64DRAFT_1723823 [Phycomyces blakesleeanus]|uniref:AT hook domain-containing protein n=2 Tax=Phycomyces blakesleeanus TaxID=4837 RepID=A0A162V6J1_PHYB8|nr:hypothetical protein PHYBLDRAFT_156861 [Phycomyces blakesleeanus NRRL 1555(-)]OAD80363.1 hypothetical protein PHYBLDRAFT_156861 [Phycomyces blakesleeanus NRRL 1555(-)]|eukprot:XP_018298403.1 hypothetical protein PHYBLDRAFT_156861 [Phycomyces blakesleeanus NRRL 1555(-)]
MISKNENDTQQPRRGPGRPRKIPREGDVIGVSGKTIASPAKIPRPTSSTDGPRKRGRPPKKATPPQPAFLLSSTTSTSTSHHSHSLHHHPASILASKNDILDNLDDDVSDSGLHRRGRSFKKETDTLDEFEIEALSLSLVAKEVAPIIKKRGRPRKLDGISKKPKIQTSSDQSGTKRGPGRPKKIQV